MGLLWTAIGPVHSHVDDVNGTRRIPSYIDYEKT
jgi:hypothetical protein